MVLSLLLFGRFFAQRVGGFLFAGRRGDELHAARGSFALALADEIEELLQIVTGLAREVVARLADFSQDVIWFHGSRFQLTCARPLAGSPATTTVIQKMIQESFTPPARRRIASFFISNTPVQKPLCGFYVHVLMS